MHPALRSYVGVADLLVRTFADCEVVLHDLTVPQRSVVYVANPVVTGRKVGESFEHLIEEAIKAGNPEDGILANYYFEKNGRLIRSSTLLIRDDSERWSELCASTWIPEPPRKRWTTCRHCCRDSPRAANTCRQLHQSQRSRTNSLESFPNKVSRISWPILWIELCRKMQAANDSHAKLVCECSNSWIVAGVPC